MDEIEKALRELVKAVEKNSCVANVKVTVTIAKPKPGKAEQRKPDAKGG